MYFPFWITDCPILTVVGIWTSIYVQVCVKIQYISEREADKQKWHVINSLLLMLHDVGPDPHVPAHAYVKINLS